MAVCGQPPFPNRAFRTRGKPCAGGGVVRLARRGGWCALRGPPCAGGFQCEFALLTNTAVFTMN